MEAIILGKGKRYTEEEVKIINDENFLFTCTCCNTVKPNKEFPKATLRYSNINKGRHYNSCCKQCKSDKYKNNAEKARLWNIKKKFNLDKIMYDNMHEHQNEQCAICGSTKKENYNRMLAVDHDHTTGQIRGLLCMKCNVGLGNFKDDPDLLNNAMVYLNKFLIK